jgi:hypothetical protein
MRLLALSRPAQKIGARRRHCGIALPALLQRDFIHILLGNRQVVIAAAAVVTIGQQVWYLGDECLV